MSKHKRSSDFGRLRQWQVLSSLMAAGIVSGCANNSATWHDPPLVGGSFACIKAVDSVSPATSLTADSEVVAADYVVDQDRSFGSGVSTEARDSEFFVQQAEPIRPTCPPPLVVVQSDEAPLPRAYNATEDTPLLEVESLAIPPTDRQSPENLALLHLDQAIGMVLQNDPVLRAGFEEIAQARAEFVTSSLRPNPELEVIQSLLPLDRRFVADVNEGGPPQLDVLLAYPVDWFLFGKRVAAMRSASAEVRVSRAQYADLVRERVLEASLAYYDVMEAQALVDLARQDSDNLLLVEEVTSIAVENGAVPQVELSRIRLDRLNSQQALREAVRDLRTAKADLLAAIGGEPPSSFDPESDFRVNDQLTVPLAEGVAEQLQSEVERVVATAVANRPDIQALQLRVTRGRAEVESQRREAYPEVVPMFGYTRQFQQRAIGFPDANSWGLGVAMTLPVSDRNQGNRLLAAAQWRQGDRELQAGLVQLRAEVVRVVAELETARVNASAIAEDQLQLAEQVRDAIRQAYEAGGRPLIDVLDSQRNFRETYGNYISSRADYLRAVQRLNAVVGTQMLGAPGP